MKRVIEIDIMKGVCIVFVVLSHMSWPMGMVKWLMSFELAVFMICSGMVYQEKRVANFIKKIVSAYLVWSMFISICWAVYTGNPIQFTNILLGGSAPDWIINGGAALWYLPCLCVVEVLYFSLKKWHNASMTVTICVLSGILAWYVSPYRESVLIPWSADIALWFLPLFAIGNMVGKYILCKFQKIGTIGLMIGSVLLGYVLYSISANMELINIFRASYRRNFYMHYIAGILGYLLCIFLSILIKRARIAPLFLWLSYHTIPILGTHQFIIYVIKPKMENVIKENTTIHKMFILIVEFLIVMFLECFVIYIVDKLKYRLSEMSNTAIIKERNVKSK